MGGFGAVDAGEVPSSGWAWDVALEHGCFRAELGVPHVASCIINHSYFTHLVHFTCHICCTNTYYTSHDHCTNLNYYTQLIVCLCHNSYTDYR